MMRDSLTLFTFIAVGLPLILAAQAIYGPIQQTPLNPVTHNTLNAHSDSVTAQTAIIPGVVPIPNSATPSLGNVTVVIGPGLTLGITTQLKVFNGLVLLTRNIDFSHIVKSSSSSSSNSISKTKEDHPNTKQEWPESQIALYAKSKNPTHTLVDVIPIAIPVPGLNSTIQGNATITVDPKGGLRVGGGFKVLKASTVAFTKGLTLTPFTGSTSGSSYPNPSDLKKRFGFFADQCKAAADCSPGGRRNIPCACTGLPGFRKCQCIQIGADNTVNFDTFGGVQSNGDIDIKLS